MKVSNDDFNVLKMAIETAWKKYPALPESRKEYLRQGLTDTRWMWDVFWRLHDAGFIPSAWSKPYKDAHIETALKKALN